MELSIGPKALTKAVDDLMDADAREPIGDEPITREVAETAIRSWVWSVVADMLDDVNHFGFGPKRLGDLTAMIRNARQTP